VQYFFPNEATRKEQLDAVTKAFKALEKEIPLARRALEAEFRAILGEAAHLHPNKIVRT
jgi:hypothetical protein